MEIENLIVSSNSSVLQVFVQLIIRNLSSVGQSWPSHTFVCCSTSVFNQQSDRLSLLACLCSLFLFPAIPVPSLRIITVQCPRVAINYWISRTNTHYNTLLFQITNRTGVNECVSVCPSLRKTMYPKKQAHWKKGPGCASAGEPFVLSGDIYFACHSVARLAAAVDVDAAAPKESPKSSSSSLVLAGHKKGLNAVRQSNNSLFVISSWLPMSMGKAGHSLKRKRKKEKKWVIWQQKMPFFSRVMMI